MANYREDIVDIELTGGSIHRSFAQHAIGGGDEAANRFGIRTFRNGEPENISGNCFGLFIRADGETVAINNGTVSGNVAYVTLPSACYAVEGCFSLAIKVTGTNMTGTMRIVDGVVDRTSTDTPVDPGTILPSIDDLIEAINEAVASIPPDYSDLVEESFLNGYSLPSNLALNDINKNSVYQLSNAVSGSPIGGSAIVVTNLFTDDASIRTQLYISYSQRRVFYRYFQDNTWSAFVELTSLVNQGTLTDGSDLDDINKPCIAGVQAGATHIPDHYPQDFGSSAGVIATVNLGAYNSGFFVQTAINYSNGKIRTRSRNGSTGVWTEWFNPSGSYEYSGTLTSENDLDDVKQNAVYSVSTTSQPSNYPLGNRPGVVFTSALFDIPGYYEQIVIPYYAYSTGLNNRHAQNLCIRHCDAGTWSEWAFFKLTQRNNNGKYYAFGDSTTWGYSADQSHAQSPWNYPFIVGDLTGVEVHNLADPGQGLIKNWNTATAQDASVTGTINDMIENGDFDDTVLITVGWAYNDADYYATVDFGNPSDAIPSSDTGITTWLGYYARVMAKLQEAAPSAMIVLVTGFGYTTNTAGHKTDEQFTKTRTFRDGDKTFKQMYDALEEMANYNGWYCINQAKGSAINRVNGSDIIGDNIHPTYDGYKLYGNFVASRIAAIFQNV